MTDQPATEKWQILCVDDEQSVLNSLKRVFRGQPYELTMTTNPQEALEIFRGQSFDLVISDMRMPGMSGAEFLASSLSVNPDCIRILLTGYSDIESTVQAINEGKIHRYVQKPWNNDDLLLIVEQSLATLTLKRENKALNHELEEKNRALENVNSELESKVQIRTRQIRQAMQKLEKAHLSLNQTLLATVKSFYNVISLVPHLGGQPVMQTAELCKRIAIHEGLEKSAIRNVYLAGMLHQLGMVGLEENIILTPRSQLSEDESEQFYAHPEKAALTLAPSQVMTPVTRIIRAQYQPTDQLKETGQYSDDMILCARILSVARDFILATEGLLLDTRCSIDSAIEHLTQADKQLYPDNLIQALANIADQVMDNARLSSDEQKLRLSEIKPGMKLTRNLLNNENILLLAEGHIFSQESIVRLRTFDTDTQNPLEVFIMEITPDESDHPEEVSESSD